jgi:predicted  nucleic acid-binding Zn-ribbon protein
MLIPKQLMDEPPPPSAYVDQFMADLALIPEALVAKLAEGIPEDEVVLPIEKIRTHITANPTRIPQLFALVVREMPYYQVLRHFEWMERKELFRKYGAKLIEALGPARACLGFMAIAVLETGDKAPFAAIPRLKADVKMDVSPPPDVQKVAELDEELSKKLVPMESLGKGDLAQALAAAEKRAVKAEKELKDAQQGWLKREKRLLGDAERAKKNEAEKAMGESGKASQAIVDTLRRDLEQAKNSLTKAETELKAVKSRIQEIEDCGGATPESLQKIKDSYAKHAEEQIRHEVSEIVRPWLVKLIEAEAHQAELGRLEKVTTELLEKTKSAVLEQDILQRWELNRERALPALGRQLEEMDRLMAMVLSPSPELVRAHETLREEVMKCRQALKPSEALGGVTTAMMAGVRSAPDDALPGLISAIEQLVDAKVIDGKEGDALRRFIAGEKSLRSDKKNAKTSTRQKLSSAIHAAKPVDIFVDAYNFMHTVHQHFQKLQMESKYHKGKFSFGPEARAHLAKLVSRIYPLDEHARVLLFIDGANHENLSPYKGVQFVVPTIKRTGEGQADAEIVHYIAHKARKEAFVVAVSNDGQVQTVANFHLSPGEFARFLEDLG